MKRIVKYYLDVTYPVCAPELEWLFGKHTCKTILHDTLVNLIVMFLYLRVTHVLAPLLSDLIVVFPTTPTSLPLLRYRKVNIK